MFLSFCCVFHSIKKFPPQVNKYTVRNEQNPLLLLIGSKFDFSKICRSKTEVKREKRRNREELRNNLRIT